MIAISNELQIKFSDKHADDGLYGRLMGIRIGGAPLPILTINIDNHSVGIYDKYTGVENRVITGRDVTVTFLPGITIPMMVEILQMIEGMQ